MVQSFGDFCSKICEYTWSCATDSKLELTNYYAINIGSEILNLLDKKEVPY